MAPTVSVKPKACSSIAVLEARNKQKRGNPESWPEKQNFLTLSRFANNPMIIDILYKLNGVFRRHICGLRRGWMMVLN
jgi:hypothetical protein